MSTSSLKIVAVCLVVYISAGEAKNPNEIKNGLLAGYGRSRHQVSLLVGLKHICGGNIISKKHIITAANCVVLEKGIFQANIKVLSGVFNRLNSSTAALHRVAYIFFHEDYVPENFWAHNIAILQLAEEIVFSAARSMAFFSYLPLQSHDFVSASGWDENISDTNLKKINMRIIAWKKCKEIYGYLNPEQSCSQPNRLGTSLTKGDAGGAVIRNDLIIGIISVSVPFRVDIPVIFTAVIHYANWIRAVIEEK